MAHGNYGARLRDPRWQRRRLEIMSAANWRCADCKSEDITLNVHHVSYRAGAAPWEYPDSELVCLCEDCHLTRHLREKATNPDLDLALEEAIDQAHQILTQTPAHDTRVLAARVMASLINLRSPKQVELMELARGLR